MRAKMVLTLFGLLAAGTLLGGCGTGGDLGFLYGFFGSGTTPGSNSGQPVNGALVGTVFQRTADNRILILDNTAVATPERVPVAGAVVAIPALSRQTSTDRLGRYLLGSVPAGDHDVTFTLPAALGGAVATFRIRVVAGQLTQGVPWTPTN